MPDFNYRAVDKTGKNVNGILYADNEFELDNQLKNIGYWLIEFSVVNKKKLPVKIKVSRLELIEFCTTMSALLHAGIGIIDCIKSVIEEVDNPGFSHVLEDIALNISAGNTLVSSMQKHPEVFPEQMCNLINAAEYSGNLVEAFKDVAAYLEWTDRLIKDIKQVSLYPSIIFIVVCCFILLLFSFVVPKFTILFDSIDVELPLITQIVVNVSDFSKQYWYLFLLIPFVIYKLIAYAANRFDGFSFFLDKLKLKIPIFGAVIHMLCLSRFSHNMAVLIRSGIPILQCLELCRDLTGNKVVSAAIRDAELAVNEGRTVSEVFKTHSVFPPTLLRMIVVGEETGTMEQSFNHVSARYDDEIPRRIKKIMGIIEPTIIISLVIIVGAVAMAIFLPLMKLMGSVG